MPNTPRHSPGFSSNPEQYNQFIPPNEWMNKTLGNVNQPRYMNPVNLYMQQFGNRFSANPWAVQMNTYRFGIQNNTPYMYGRGGRMYSPANFYRASSFGRFNYLRYSNGMGGYSNRYPQRYSPWMRGGRYYQRRPSSAYQGNRQITSSNSYSQYGRVAFGQNTIASPTSTNTESPPSNNEQPVEVQSFGSSNVISSQPKEEQTPNPKEELRRQELTAVAKLLNDELQDITDKNGKSIYRVHVESVGETTHILSIENAENLSLDPRDAEILSSFSLVLLGATRPYVYTLTQNTSGKKKQIPLAENVYSQILGPAVARSLGNVIRRIQDRPERTVNFDTIDDPSLANENDNSVILVNEGPGTSVQLWFPSAKEKQFVSNAMVHLKHYANWIGQQVEIRGGENNLEITIGNRKMNLPLKKKNGILQNSADVALGIQKFAGVIRDTHSLPERDNVHDWYKKWEQKAENLIKNNKNEFEDLSAAMEELRILILGSNQNNYTWLPAKLLQLRNAVSAELFRRSMLKEYKKGLPTSASLTLETVVSVGRVAVFKMQVGYEGKVCVINFGIKSDNINNFERTDFDPENSIIAIHSFSVDDVPHASVRSGVLSPSLLRALLRHFAGVPLEDFTIPANIRREQMQLATVRLMDEMSDMVNGKGEPLYIIVAQDNGVMLKAVDESNKGIDFYLECTFTNPIRIDGLYRVVNDEINYFDELELLESLPFTDEYIREAANIIRRTQGKTQNSIHT